MPRFWFPLLLSMAALGLVVACEPYDTRTFGNHDHGHAHRGHSHQGHDHHGHSDHLTLTRFTGRLMVYIEYEPLVAGQRANLHVHLTDRQTNGPVKSGRLSVVLSGLEEKGAAEFSTESPDEPGIYDISGQIERAGAYAAQLHLITDDWQETVELGELIAYPDHRAAHLALHRQPATPPDAIHLHIEQQWETSLRSEPTVRRTLVERVEVPGRIEAPQGSTATVAAPVEGRLVASDDRSLPRLGEHVAAGEILGWVELTLSADRAAAWAADRASLQATRGEIALRRLDVGRQETEARRALAEARAEVAFHRETYSRIKQAHQEGAVPDQEVRRAERDATTAEARLVEAEDLATLYADARKELEQMASSLAEATQTLSNGDMLPRLPLVAPIAGRVIEVPAVEGEQLQGGQSLYQILNDDQMWLAARVGEFDVGRLNDLPSVRVRLDDGSDRWLDLEPEALVDMAGPITGEDRSAIVRYVIENAQHRLRPGLSVTAFIETRRTTDAVTVPEGAVLLDAGRPVVFVHVSGETFEKRRVELGIRDGPQVEIRSGLDAGQRVVTHGAYTVKLAGQEPAEMGHGHVH